LGKALGLNVAPSLTIGELVMIRKLVGMETTIFDDERGRFCSVLLNDDEVRKVFAFLLPTTIKMVKTKIENRKRWWKTKLADELKKLKQDISYLEKDERFAHELGHAKEKKKSLEEKIKRFRRELEELNQELILLTQLHELYFGET